MDNEKIRTALKEELAAERRKKRRQRVWRALISAMILLCVMAISFPFVSAKYIAYLETLTPAGLDSVTNTDLTAALYPVGSIYISADNIDPGSVFGGTWAALPSGHCLVSEGGAYSVLSTGGSFTASNRSAAVSGTVSGVGGTVSAITGIAAGVGAGQPLTANITGVGGNFTASGGFTLTAANLPSHNHSIPSHTHSFPNHSHTFLYRNAKNHQPGDGGDRSSEYEFYDGVERRGYWAGNNNRENNHNPYNTANPTNDSGGPNVANTDSTGSGTEKAGIASSGTAAGLTGSATLTSAAAGYSGAVSVSGTASDLSGTVSGTVTAPDATMQPYRVVYIWRRTA